MIPARRSLRLGVVIAPGLLGAVALALHGPFGDFPAYHDFADARSWLGIPNFWNVASNLPFVLAGLAGLAGLATGRGTFGDRQERAPFVILFLGLVLTGLGSAYYHWAPSPETLFWDRLPLTLVITSWFAATVAERVAPPAGRRLFVPALAMGAASVLHWHATADVRLYALVQFYPLLAIPLMLALFPPRYTGGRALAAVIACYAGAKVCESLDVRIFELLGGLSGHTIKHLLAGAAAWLLVRAVLRRRAIGVAQPTYLNRSTYFLSVE